MARKLGTPRGALQAPVTSLSSSCEAEFAKIHSTVEVPANA
jgi:hypothetical protein